MDSLKAEVNSHTVTTVDKFIRGYDKHNNNRHTKNEAAIQHPSVSEQSQDRKNNDHESRLAALEKRADMQVAAPTVHDMQTEIDWESSPDTTLLRGNTHEGALCSLDAVKSMAVAWLAGSGIEVGMHVSIFAGNNPMIGTRMFQFLGEAKQAAITAQRALKLLRSPSGGYVDLLVVLPSGNSAKFYLSPDKNGKNIAQEKTGKNFIKHSNTFTLTLTSS